MCGYCIWQGRSVDGNLPSLICMILHLRITHYIMLWGKMCEICKCTVLLSISNISKHVLYMFAFAHHHLVCMVQCAGIAFGYADVLIVIFPHLFAWRYISEDHTQHPAVRKDVRDLQMHRTHFDDIHVDHPADDKEVVGWWVGILDLGSFAVLGPLCGNKHMRVGGGLKSHWIHTTHIGFTLDSHLTHIGFALDSHRVHIGLALDSHCINIGLTFALDSH